MVKIFRWLKILQQQWQMTLPTRSTEIITKGTTGLWKTPVTWILSLDGEWTNSWRTQKALRIPSLFMTPASRWLQIQMVKKPNTLVAKMFVITTAPPLLWKQEMSLRQTSNVPGNTWYMRSVPPLPLKLSITDKGVAQYSEPN